jgi:hypothetical protein
MTAVGKILVILNLVFAFVVGTFAVMTYIARTHWADQYKKLENSYQVVKATSDTYKADNDKLVKERDAYNKALLESGTRAGVINEKQDPSKAAQATIDLLKKRQDETVALKADLKREKDKSDGFERQANQYKATMTVAQTGQQRQQEDLVKLREVLADETKRNTKLVEGINYMRDRAVAAEIESKSYKARNGQLETQLQDLARQIAVVKAQGGRPVGAASGSGRNPPPEAVEGLIQRIDGKLVTLTIGSDAGLQKGHTLYVFGLTGNTGYRGQIKLVEVTPKVAVGEVMGKLSSAIRVGDTASSEIMPRK